MAESSRPVLKPKSPDESAPPPSKSSTCCGSDVFDKWWADVEAGTPPVRYRVGDGAFEHVWVAPGRIVVIAGAPDAGKSALAGQWVTDALRTHADLVALVCCFEMQPSDFFTRQMARISGVRHSDVIAHKTPAECRGRIVEAREVLRAIGGRIHFLRTPFSMPHLIRAAREKEAKLVVLDHIQGFAASAGQADGMDAVNRVMAGTRKLAAEGVAVIALSHVARGGQNGGRAYTGLTMASFKGSNAIEAGADDAYILEPCGGKSKTVSFKHVKRRHSACHSAELEFNGETLHFQTAGFKKDGTDNLAKLKSQWEGTPPSGNANRGAA
jgi:hypothetical protein